MNEANNNQIQITVLRLTEAITVGQKNTLKRSIIGETNEQYSQILEFDVFGKNVPLLDNIKEEDVVNVTFSVRGREWKSPKDGSVRVFMSLSASDVRKVSEGAPADDDDLPYDDPATPPQPLDVTDKNDEDLPF